MVSDDLKKYLEITWFKYLLLTSIRHVEFFFFDYDVSSNITFVIRFEKKVELTLAKLSSIDLKAVLSENRILTQLHFLLYVGSHEVIGREVSPQN